jgi:hypothetical protein
MKKECGWCGRDMGEVDGEGVEGTTTGICPECEYIEKLKMAQNLVKTQKLTWGEAKEKVGV